MSSGLMLDYIIMNIFNNKALEYHVEVFDSYFTKTYNNKIYICRWSLQDFHWKNGTHESLDVVCPHFYVKQKNI